VAISAKLARARTALAQQFGPLWDFRERIYWVLGASAQELLTTKGFDRESWRAVTPRLVDGRIDFRINQAAAKHFGLLWPPNEDPEWKAARAAAFATFARHVVDLEVMPAVDAYGANLVRWFAGDRQASTQRTRASRMPRNVEQRKRWQEEADKLRQGDPKAYKIDLARSIASNLGGKAGTIRRTIK